MTLDVPPAMARMETGTRLERLRGLLPDKGIDALLVTDLANVRYLTGFSGSAATLLVAPAQAVIVTDGRYRTQGAEQLHAAGTDDQVRLSVGGPQAQRQALVGAVRDIGADQVGLEAEHVTWGAQRRWEEALAPIDVVPTSGIVEELRQVKDAGEIARITRAAAIADAALTEVASLVAPGRTEQEVALALDSAMRRLGAQDRAFETIVASGANAAKPHARPTAKPIESGDSVVVDFGAVCDGYRSDMTRTFCVGSPGTELARMFAVVRSAQTAGVDAVGPGVSAGSVDRVCRDMIGAAGWASAFEHGTGHGVGLDIHEAPVVAPGSTGILAAGVVLTVEPGVYVPGVGGVRIEDTVVVTEEGRRTLTRFPKDLAA